MPRRACSTSVRTKRTSLYGALACQKQSRH
jgi:hypothetical protein